ncbi:MAG: enoyl-CoA hydratase/isomerase family protein [Chloroflexi bacterium]|nr:enoyl-CoA hydratase/isomerase family protein [Chloroflexota bacterium]
MPLVLFERAAPLARITLNRPELLNAINHDVGVELFDAFRRCEDDAEIKAIVLAGAGRAFCSGDELGREHAPAEAESLERRGYVGHYMSGPGRWTNTVRLMRALPQPVVARVQGYAFGGGLNLALAADFRIMAEDAQLATPYVKRGMATGTNLLQEYIGIGRAIEMTMLGEPIDARHALALGLVTRVVPAVELDAAVDALVARLVAGPTAALRLTKQAVYAGWDEDPEGAYRHQASAVAQSQPLEDLAEGIAAFKERRPPKFVGR